MKQNNIGPMEKPYKKGIEMNKENKKMISFDELEKITGGSSSIDYSTMTPEEQEIKARKMAETFHWCNTPKEFALEVMRRGNFTIDIEAILNEYYDC